MKVVLTIFKVEKFIPLVSYIKNDFGFVDVRATNDVEVRTVDPLSEEQIALLIENLKIAGGYNNVIFVNDYYIDIEE